MARGQAPETVSTPDNVPDNTSDNSREDGQRSKTTPVVVALWLLLSGTAVIMLMGITNKLCLDIASVSFLWILPLLAYLVTFILCFASERTYRRAPCLALFALALLLTVGRPYGLRASVAEI